MIDRIAPLAGALLVALILVWVAGWTGPDQPGAALDAVWVLAASAPWALVWIAAAAGFGWPWRRLLGDDAREPAVIQIGLGVPTLMTLDTVLGRLGLLQAGGSAGAWALTLIGVTLLAAQALRGRATRLGALPPLLWAAAPAIAVLLLAACAAPGWLWSSEFGGYDALSYHLQLPREWQCLGRIEPLAHNVYSHLPGAVEAAYYHLAVMTGSGIGFVYACQLLHAMLALLAAFVVLRLGRRLAGEDERLGRMTGPVAAVLLLGTPWVVVTGSLAYDEMAATLLLAVGLALLAEPLPAGRRGALLGIVAGGAVAAKLTALLSVAAPLGLVLLFVTPPRRWAAACGAGAATAALVLAPWLTGNWIATGNPVFPFATAALGTGHWSAEQAAVWHDVHRPALGPGDRLVESAHQWWLYGFGANPAAEARPDEPWSPQWSALPWLALVALATALLLGSGQPRRRAAVLGLVLLVQLALWIGLTHVKSRFMVPAVVPATLVVAAALAAIARRWPAAVGGRAARAVAVVVLAAWSSVCLLQLAGEPAQGDPWPSLDGAPAARTGAAHMLTGEGLDDRLRRELGESASPTIHVNHLLGPGSRVLLVGDAAPLYYDPTAVAYQTTWDRGPLSAAMRAAPDRPAAWVEALRDAGFTHVMVQPAMLDRWTRDGWADPLLTSARVLAALDAHAGPPRRFPGGLLLYPL